VPAKGRHNLVDGFESTETLKAKEKIQVESEAIGLVHATDGAPCVGANKHSRLGDEVGPPREYSRCPRTCPTNPQFPSVVVHVAAVPESHHRIRIGIQGGGGCRQGTRFQ